MADLLTTVDDQMLAERFDATRRLTEQLAAPLSAEDQTVQSMPDVSPTKWHRAHTSWFFETFLLTPSLAGYEVFDPGFGFLFNSYYVGVGDRFPRPDRGLVSRPGVAEIADYRTSRRRCHGGPAGSRASIPATAGWSSSASTMSSNTRSCCSWTSSTCCPGTRRCPPTTPSRRRPPVWPPRPPGPPIPAAPRRRPCRERVRVRQRNPPSPGPPGAVLHRRPPVTCGEWIEFMDDGGYQRPELWLSDGWATVQADGWDAPSTGRTTDGGWREFTLGRRRWPSTRPGRSATSATTKPMRSPDGPATGCPPRPSGRWCHRRLADRRDGHFLDTAVLAPASRRADGAVDGPFGDVWQWTSSAYGPYPGFAPAPGRRRRVQRQVHGQPVRAAGRLMRDAGRSRPGHLPELLPPVGPLGLLGAATGP